MYRLIKYFLQVIAFTFIFTISAFAADVNAEIINGNVTGDGSIIVNVAGGNIYDPDIDLKVAKTINGKSDNVTIWQGDTLSVEIVVKNIGMDTAYDVEMMDFLDNVRIFDVYGFPGICDDLGSHIYCLKDSLAPGESMKISYIVETALNAKTGFMETYARVSASDEDDYPDNNKDSVRVTIQRAGYMMASPLYAVHLSVRHDARERNNNGNWKSANTQSTAAEISNKDTQEIQYRIIVANDGNTAGQDVKIKNYFSSDNLSRTGIKNVVNATYNSSSGTFTIPKIDAKSSVEVSYIAILKTKDFGVLQAKSTASIYNVRPSSNNLFDSSLIDITGLGETDYAYVESTGIASYISNNSSSIGGPDKTTNNTSSTTSSTRDRFPDTGEYQMPISSTVTRNTNVISSTVTRNNDYVDTTYYMPTYNVPRSNSLMRTGSSGLLVLLFSLISTFSIFAFKRFRTF